MGLSIIIPVYNAEKYLSQCLDSIVSCTKKDLEIILINDGSVDESKNICENYQKSDVRVKVYSQKNQGVSSARNYGLKKATHKKVMFFDADDMFKTHIWDTVWKYVETDYEFVAFSYDSYFDENKKLIPETFPFAEVSCSQNQKIKEILFGTPLLHTCWGKIFDLEVIQEYRCSFPIGVPIGEDYIFVMDYLMNTKKNLLLNESILLYRQTPDGAMRTFKFDVRTSGMQLIWKHCYRCMEKDHADEEIWKRFYSYQFRSYTKLLREIAGNLNLSETLNCYQQLFEDSCLKNTIRSLQVKGLPLYKKVEYQMIKRKSIMFLACYFKLKSKAGR